MVYIPEYSKITSPTLIIWGDRDIALEKDLTTMSAKYVENVRIKHLPRANHFVHWDASDEVNQYIKEFVE